MLEVTDAQYAGNYKISLTFNNRISGIVDLENALWGPVFEPLKDPAIFAKFQVSEVLHTIYWDNGADFAPEFLYDLMNAQVPAKAADS
jgi:hypothetical protein